MGMVHKVLSPGMEHGKETDFRSEVFGIGSDRAEGFRSSAEENVVNDFLILECDASYCLGDGEHNVEVLDRQKLCLPCLEPLGFCQRLAFGTVAVAAGVV